MPLPPKILSVWGSETGDDFLGSASLLDREHVLTVKHMFRDCWSEVPRYSRDTVYVADAERANSRRIQVVEPRVEHVFAALCQQGGKCVRAMTLARNALAITLQCAAYNARRLVWLVKSAGPSAQPA